MLGKELTWKRNRKGTGETEEAAVRVTSFGQEHVETPWVATPWKTGGLDSSGIERDDVDNFVMIATTFGGSQRGRDTAARIVACVNACAGIPNEALEHGIVFKMVGAMRFGLYEYHRLHELESESTIAIRCENEVCAHMSRILREVEGKETS